MSRAALNYTNLVNVQNGSGCVQIQSYDNYTSWKEDQCDGTHGFICEKFGMYIAVEIQGAQSTLPL